MTIVSSSRYYVYILMRPNGDPFYVGKGTGNRADQHEREARTGCRCPKCNIIRSIWDAGQQIRICIAFHCDDEIEAFDYERYLINMYGPTRLANKTAGQGGTRPRSALHSIRRGSNKLPEQLVTPKQAMVNTYQDEVQRRGKKGALRRAGERIGVSDETIRRAVISTGQMR